MYKVCIQISIRLVRLIVGSSYAGGQWADGDEPLYYIVSPKDVVIAKPRFLSTSDLSLSRKYDFSFYLFCNGICFIYTVITLSSSCEDSMICITA